MISTIFTKIKSYIAIAIAIIIAILIAALSTTLARVSKLKDTIDKLNIENERSKKEAQFLQSQIKILSDFENSSFTIETITNEGIFDNQKQMAINSIILDFYK